MRIVSGKTPFEIETINQQKQRKLLNTTHEFGELLIQSEFEEIMNVYQRAIDRTMSEIRKNS